MSFEKILKDIKQKNFKPVYILHGEEDYFIDQLTKAIINNGLQEHEKDFNLLTFYGKEVSVDDVIDAARRYPMMAERQIVVLKEAQMIKAQLKNFDGYISNFVPSTILIINYKNGKIDGRLKFVTQAKKIGEVFHALSLSPAKAKAWVNNFIKEKGLKIEPKAFEMMNELIGVNLTKAKIEIEKLLPNVEKDQTISAAMVQKYIGVHASYNIYELQSALARKDIAKAYKIAKYYSEGKETVIQRILFNLYLFYNKLLIYLQNSKSSDQEKLKAMKLYNSFQMQDYKVAANNYSIKNVLNAHRLIHQYDLESKGVGVANKNDWEIYKELLFKLVSS